MTVAFAPKVAPSGEIAGTDMLKMRKQNANVLASGYTWQKRCLEYASVTVFSVCFFIGVKNVILNMTANNAWMVVVALLLGMGFADIFSGLLHWGADTWGDTKTPVVSTFIRSFREHHVDPFQITRHDVVETNGDNCLVLIPIIALFDLGTVRPGCDGDLFVLVFGISLSFWVVITNQIHKWAHMLTPPPFVAAMQRWHFILDRKGHQLHHHTPFDRYYCITTGWLNPVLASVGFWKRMERSITLCFGVKPRMDDAFWTVQKAD